MTVIEKIRQHLDDYEASGENESLVEAWHLIDKLLEDSAIAGLWRKRTPPRVKGEGKYVKHCEKCGAEYRSHSSIAKYCEACVDVAAKERQKAWWREHPGYHREYDEKRRREG